MKTIILLIMLFMLLLAACSTPKIMAVQDFEKVNGKWVAVGTPHIMPDTVSTIHGLVWLKGKNIYTY